eukprot:TRINITY_DN12262_c0_g1_i3.p1 TRINITY_DN12262_c0_g1~~TRINITY_DN12262_c0_g1_i3.p1  ORF type:complete len:937 (+),score=236.23 TRINITY_DN12262_c0_g1_i3:83-2893(+)
MSDAKTPLLPNGSPGVTLTSSDETINVGVAQANSKNALGTINGCYVPCLLNIMGIVLFLRLGWATGQAGVLLAIAILCIASIQAIITVLSLSALVTNGVMSTGGSYYMISRCLGPEFGGAIGLLFYCAYAMGVAFYTIGFATTVQTTFFPDTSEPLWMIRGIGSAGLLFVLSISLTGAEFFAKFNVMFFAIQFGAIAIAMVSFWVPHHFDSYDTVTGDKFRASAEFPQHFRNNTFPHFTKSDSCAGQTCRFHDIFAILFPMVTGIMEGANLSGDLKNPAKSIPTGTLYALLTAFVIYTILILSMGGSFTRYDLQTDQNIFQNATLGSSYIVVTGIIISSISSALGSLFGGSRVLQAMARDDLMPILSPFKYGTAHGDEPRVAVLFTWAVAQGCVMIGDIDTVAPIETAFFCLSYACCNLACFVLSAMEAPNFRPKFKYYSWPVALIGAILNLGIMVYLNWMYAIISVGCMGLLFLYLSHYGPVTEWGDITNELIFHQVRKYLLRLEQTGATPTKFWKPNLLVLVDNCDTGMLAFCNSLKKGGLLVLAQVIVGSLDTYHRVADSLRRYWADFVKQAKLKAFVHTTCADEARAAYRVLISASGLGGLSINTVVLPFFEVAGLTTTRTKAELERSNRLQYTDLEQKLQRQFSSDDEGMGSCNLPVTSAQEYCGIINDALLMRKNVIVGRNFATGERGKKGRLYTHTSALPNVDVWLWGDWEFRPAQNRAGWAPSVNMQASDTSTVRMKSMSDVRSSVVMDPDNPMCLEGIVSLLVQFGYLFSRSRLGPGGLRHNRKLHRLRFIHVLDSDNSDIEASVARIMQLCEEARIEVDQQDVKVISPTTLRDLVPTFAEWCHGATRPVISAMPPGLQAQTLNSVIKLNSSNTCQVFLPLVEPPKDGAPVSECEAYIQTLSELTKELPPCALVADGEKTSVISTDI